MLEINWVRFFSGIAYAILNFCAIADNTSQYNWLKLLGLFSISFYFSRGFHKCMPNTRSRGNSLVVLDPKMERTL